MDRQRYGRFAAVTGLAVPPGLPVLLGLAVLGLAVTFTVVGCAQKRPAAVPPPPPPPVEETASDVEHRVTYSGETLGMIASWYTGRAQNWKAILEANPGLRPERITIGRTITVPGDLVIQREPMPKRFVQDLVAKMRAGRTAPAASADPGETASGDIVPPPSDTLTPPPTAAQPPPQVDDLLGESAAPSKAPDAPAAAAGSADGTAAGPASDTEREKLLDELLAQ